MNDNQESTHLIKINTALGGNFPNQIRRITIRRNNQIMARVNEIHNRSNINRPSKS